MAEPIYVLFLNRLTEAWYQLSREEQDSYMAELTKVNEKFGVKFPIACDSSWSSEQWPHFGVMEISDIETLQKRAKALNEIKHWRYFESMTVLGTKWESS